MDDKFNLERFIKAQDGSYWGYQIALSEMRNGGKHSHWIWYIFPQIEGLGRSGMSSTYGIASLEEAKAYLEHPVLGERLREITNVVLSYPADADPNIFMMQPIDAKKLMSSMTLFDMVAPNDIFGQVLEKFFRGRKCYHTLRMVGK